MLLRFCFSKIRFFCAEIAEIFVASLHVAKSCAGAAAAQSEAQLRYSDAADELRSLGERPQRRAETGEGTVPCEM